MTLYISYVSIGFFIFHSLFAKTKQWGGESIYQVKIPPP